MFKLWHNCTHLTCQQSSAQNSPSQASTVLELRTSRYSRWIQKRQRNHRSNCQRTLDHQKSMRVPKKQPLLFIDYAKAFDCVHHNKLQKILKELGIPDHLTCLLRNLYSGQEATIRTGYGTRLVPAWERSTQAVYCHPFYLIYMQSTSCEKPGWMKHKLESRLSGEISITSDMQMTSLLWQKFKRAKEPLDESERAE